MEGKSSLEPPQSPKADQYVYDLYYRDLRPSLSSPPLGLGLGKGISVGALSVFLSQFARFEADWSQAWLPG